MTPEAKEEREDIHGLGMVHVYTGNGKGKTTASMGLALRSTGHGFRTKIIQFYKGGKHIGERIAIKKFLKDQVEIEQFGKPCTYSHLLKKGAAECGNCRDCFLSREEEKEKAEEALMAAKKATRSGEWNVVICDEINIALSKKAISVDSVLDLVKNKNKDVELILTGRGAPSEIIHEADLVTEMVEIKHPMVSGTFGRRGVEY